MAETTWPPSPLRHLLFLRGAPDMPDTLRTILRRNGFVVESVALDEAPVRSPYRNHDAILIDPDEAFQRGLDVCREMRKKGERKPILMLAGMEERGQRVAALEAGADDCLPKTLDLDELTSRIRGIVELNAAVSPRIMMRGTILLNADSHTVTLDGKPVDLSPREFALLELFMSNPDRALSRQDILDQVWDFNYRSNVVDVYVRYLRDKLGQSVIQTVRGIGYRFSPTPSGPPQTIDLTTPQSQPTITKS
jgi:DNA-binding response OmpR family regulator